MSRILLWCSATSMDVLKQCDDRDRIRQSILGAFVLLTATAAFASSLQALNKIDAPPGVALAGALVWAALILTLDRFLVSSVRISQRNTGEFKVKGWSVIPRVILAMAIGGVIGIPVELYVFREEIKEKIEYQSRDILLQAAAAARNKIEKFCRDHYFADQDKANKAVEHWGEKIAFTNEGLDKSGKGEGPVYRGYATQLKKAVESQATVQERTRQCVREKAANVESAAKELAELERGLQDLIAREARKRVQSTLLTEMVALNALRHPAQADGALPESRALSDAARAQEESRAGVIVAATYAVPLLFILFEVCPILAKLLGGISRYDLISATDMATEVIRSRREIEIANASLAGVALHIGDGQDLARKERELANQTTLDLFERFRDVVLRRGSDMMAAWPAQTAPEHPVISRVIGGLLGRFEATMANDANLRRAIESDPIANSFNGHANAAGVSGATQARAEPGTESPSWVDETSRGSPDASPRPAVTSRSPDHGSDAPRKREPLHEVFRKKIVESFGGKVPEYFSSIVQSTVGPPMAAMTLMFTLLGAGGATATALSGLFAALMIFASYRLLLKRSLP